MLGWMALTGAASTPRGMAGVIRVHVLPRSLVRSKWICHPGCTPSRSVLEGHRIEPSGSATGLFLIGPRKPSGRRCGGDHVLPPSAEVVISPHQLRGSGPTL